MELVREPAPGRAALRRRRGAPLGRRRPAPVVLSPGTSTRCRRRATSRAGSRTAPCTGSARRDMKGGVAVMLELARWAPAPTRLRPASSSSRARRSRSRRARCRRCSRRGAARRRRARGRARADRLHPPRRLPRQPQGAGRLPRRERALGAAVDGRERDHELARRASRGSLELEPLDVELDGLVYREVLSAVRVDGGDRRERRARRRVERELNFRYAPGPHAATRRRRGCASSCRTASCASLHNSPAAPPGARATRSSQRLREPRARGRAEAGVDAGGAVRRAGHRRDQLRPGRDAYAHRRDEQIPIANLERCFETLQRFLASVSLVTCNSPRSSRRWHLSVRRGSRRRGGGCAAEGVEVIDFGKGDPNEPTDPLIRRGARRRRCRSARRIRSPQGLPELREAAAGWCGRRFGVELDPETEIVPTLRLEGGDLLARAGVVDPARQTRSCVHASPAYPVYERGALFAGARSRRCRCCARTASCPTSTRSTGRGTIGAPLGQLPEQPDGRASRRSRSTSELAARAPRARLRRRLRRGVHGALVRRAAAVGARRSADRSRIVVFQTLSKRSSMTGYRSGLRRGAAGGRRGAEGVPADGRDGAAGVRPARLGRGLGRRAPRRGDARALPREARGAAAGAASARAGRSSAARRRCTSGVASRAASRRRRSRRGCSSTGSIVSPGAFFGPSGEGYVRFALVPTLEECERARPRSWRGPVTRRARRRRSIAALDRGEAAASPRRSDGEWRVNEEAKAAILDVLPAAQAGADRGRAVRVPRQDPAQARPRGARRARRAAGDGALRRRSSRRASC